MRNTLLVLGVFLTFSAAAACAQAVAPSEDPAAAPAVQTTQPAVNDTAATEPQQTATDADQESSAPKRHVHFRLGTISLGAGYSHWSEGPYYPYHFFSNEPYGFYPYPEYGAKSPWIWNPLWTG